MPRPPAMPRPAPRIAIASSGLGHVTRGIESWAEDLGNALHARGADVRLCRAAGPVAGPHERLIPCWTRTSAAARRAHRLLPRALGWRVGLESTYGVEQASFALGLIRVLRRERVDILHVQDPFLASLARRAARLGWVRARTILADGTEEAPEFLAGFPYVQHLAPWHLEQARDRGFHRPTWTAIPNFIAAETFHPGRADALRAELGIPPGATVVLAASAIKRGHKRVDHLVAEFARLVEADPGRPAFLVVAGGREAETDEVIAEGRARLGDRVRFLVQFPRARMAELYRAADLFAMTSLKEMMPIALLEALASGLPCLVHDHPVLRWMIGPGGRVVDMAAPGALAGALAAALDDPAWRVDVGSRARRHGVEVFGRDAVLDQILDYYAAVLGRPT